MGVPKFFRYTSERYPCLNELVKQYQIPDFDNMYLDMNGIVHNCSHPDDTNAHFRITEEKIFEDIFHYISILFQIIKPKKLFFMAIDGVAPRAKMNQQRGRRFRSAREAEKIEEEAKKRGEELPTEQRFDSNCITPGTVFMVKLQEQLKYFVKQKLSSDPLWANVKVILSGHETPGEGEHKIMDYIRWARSQSDYDPNTRHCLYGLDADLIMLGMCTHEPHFALLREEVKFGKSTQRATSPEETNFYLLHLSLLREYLEQEFIEIKDKLSFKYDIENIVDDWVLMGFLVGNDFIPNLPNMHISNESMPILYKTYMAVLPTLDGYINEAGDLHLGRFEAFLQELAKIDKEMFQETYADLKYFGEKTGERMNINFRKQYKPNNDETFNVDINEIKAHKPDDELQALINATEDMLLCESNMDEGDDEYETETSDEEANFNMEFKLHKRDYYINKLDYSKVTKEVLMSQAEGYVRAIQWNLYYYYKGCPSWCWYYPHHYAPYISDITGFKDLKIEFELGEPFKPFEQLLAVLPAASKNLLPEPFHELMTEENSPIVTYYPINFETDLNGKKNDWEAVVLIPFIEEKNLLSAMKPCYEVLTEEEKNRNTHGPMRIYTWSANSLGVANAPEYFPPIRDCRAFEKLVRREDLYVPENKLVRGMLPNATRDLVYPGFPTTRHLKYESFLKKCRVKVFDQPSVNNNMILKLIRDPAPEPHIDDVARELLGKEIWVGWPHLTKAKVITVSNEAVRHHLLDRPCGAAAADFNTEVNEGNLHKQWIAERSTVIEHNMNRLGIELGDVNIIIHAVNLKGYKYILEKNVQMTLEPEWCQVPCGYALQAVVTDVKAHVIETVTKYSTPQEAFPPGGEVFLLTQGQYYGSLAKIVDSSMVSRGGRIKVSLLEAPEPVPSATYAVPYKSTHHAAAACGITPHILGRITGCVFVVKGERNGLPTDTMKKLNIGLNLKFNKRNQEVTGYTKRGFNNAWQYSERCVQLVAEYARAYPELFATLSRNLSNDIFFEAELWPDNIGEGKPEEVIQWLNKQSHSKAARRECGTEALEPEEMKQLAQSIDAQLKSIKQHKKVTLQVKINLLYKHDLHSGNIAPDPQADFQINDRVVCVANNITVPLGAKGTVTAVHKPGASNTVRLSDKLNSDETYQILFDEPFPGAMTEELFEEARVYKLQPAKLLNISYGRKLRNAVPPSHNNNTHLSRTPNILRREDGHHSAFANYSPTIDKHTPTNEASAVAAPTPKATNVQNDGTEMLKSLLKISMPANTPTTNTNKDSEFNKNWRAKSDQPPQQPTMRQTNSAQPKNWRRETRGETAPPKTGPPPLNEWYNHFKQSQRPLLPFPINHPYHQPAANQIPFPQFQNQPQQSRSNFYPDFHTQHQAGPRMPKGKQMPDNGALPNAAPVPNLMPPSNWIKQNPQSSVAGPSNMVPSNMVPSNIVPSNRVPSNMVPNNMLPNNMVPSNILPNNMVPSNMLPNNMVPSNMVPSNMVSNNMVPNNMVPSNTVPQSPLERINNPFVPLQVQAKRRVHNPVGGTNRTNNAGGNVIPRQVPVSAPQPVVNVQNPPFEPGPVQNRLQKKKKSRIAANLPFMN